LFVFFLCGLGAFQKTLAQNGEFSDEIFGLLTAECRGVDFDGQLFGDGLVGAAGQTKPAGAAGKLKQFALPATDAAPQIRPLFTALLTA
jgi:hypothetical protein